MHVLFVISSAMVEHEQEREEHHDSALLSLSDWFHQLVGSVASRFKAKRSIEKEQSKRGPNIYVYFVRLCQYSF